MTRTHRAGDIAAGGGATRRTGRASTAANAWSGPRRAASARRSRDASDSIVSRFGEGTT